MSYDGLEPAELAQRLRAPSCLSLVKVTSTLDIVHQLAAEGAPAGTVVVADEQVAGRGRFGRRWRSPPKVGIWLGYLVRPAEPLESGVLAIRVGLCLVDVLRELQIEASLKWPNDVVVGHRKVAGVLCEARWLRQQVQWIAIGIGVNVHRSTPREGKGRAAALEDASPGVSRIAVLERLVPRLHRISQDPRLAPGELEAFHSRDWLSGRQLREPLAGRARGIDASGALLIETSHGVLRASGGTVVTA